MIHYKYHLPPPFWLPDLQGGGGEYMVWQKNICEEEEIKVLAGGII